MADGEEDSGQPHAAHLRSGLRPGTQLDEIARNLRELAAAKDRLQGLLDAVLAMSREEDLSAVLHRFVTTAMDLTGARYGALGVLDESGEELEQFITAGLSESERAALAGTAFPRGRGVLGHLIHNPGPLRVDDIASHPASVGFPPGHPPMRTLLGVAITVRGTIYGDLYLSERRDGRPFDGDDEAVVITLAGAAGIAIENIRLLEAHRDSAEHFQRLLLPALPDLYPFTGAATYRPAATPGHLGGDWYDALWLPDNACAAVIGDVVGHDLHAAAAMAQTRSMLRALLYDRLTPPSTILHQLDRTLHAITDLPVTTACLARIEPAGADGWTLLWSTAGHLPPLLITPDRQAHHLHAEPGLPLAVSTEQRRPDHTRPLPPGATVVLYTDGLVEHPARTIDDGLTRLAELATAYIGLPLQDFVDTLADHHPSDGHDDMAILALRTPPTAEVEPRCEALIRSPHRRSDARTARREP
ncbi:SpoIIE family protein phosphatase [Streptomyces sp. MUM 203J]|uniref:PP2C family protein-serine/threonine phosphatase n=1 Tax=Streptomyces sp. MUM 203J TaxID=2791990 RepID=UPI001F0332FB|nr:GAF domain-containing SpoIIE family protein phosphatase [Streptomyces sp. MUM 203J]MCH0541006.1 SpoIIE family protein phosphatase [Streptomyces sp. MUM 203J]